MADETAAGGAALRNGHRLQQAGAALLLLGLLVGLTVPHLALPRLALSAHLLGITQGTLLLAVGQLWPRLRLTARRSGLGSLLAIYGCGAAWTANLLGAVWGAGGSMVPLATGGVRGSAVQEVLIKVLLVSAALSLVLFGVTLLWGLRGGPADRSNEQARG